MKQLKNKTVFYKGKYINREVFNAFSDEEKSEMAKSVPQYFEEILSVTEAEDLEKKNTDLEKENAELKAKIAELEAKKK